MEVLLAGIVVQLAGGVGAFAVSRSARLASAAGVAGAVVGALLGLAPTVGVLLDGQPLARELPWDTAHGSFHVEVDALGAAFLVPVLGLTVVSAIYGADYLLAYEGKKSLGAPWFFFNLFVVGMALVIIARTVVLFLIAWEVMSLAAYFLVTFEHENERARRAGWIYLVATHLGVAILFAAFVLLASHAGNAAQLDFTAFRSLTLSAEAAGAVFVLALIGFGTKAGLVPFHVWLPEAHPAAPSHVSALMSGVMIKMGLYGLLRMLTFLGPPAPWWGLSLAGIGMLTALVGISLALHQRDMKRVLAYSSIENIGLIALSLGVGVWGQATRQPLVAALGMAGALLHIWNHALMKGLAFLTAGSILHATGTKNLEQLGGLMKRMPWTGTSMFVGAVAIAALPPLNGFTSKWLMYLTLLQCGTASAGEHVVAPLLAVGLLALVGGLAAVAFVRLTGIALLGSARSQAAAQAHEASPWMLGPILLLVVLCVTLAVLPSCGLNLLGEPLLQILDRRDAAALQAILRERVVPVGSFNAWLLGTLAATALLLVALLRKSAHVEGPTWGCGYQQPSARMQYTGRSFTELLVVSFLPRFLRPRSTKKAPEGLFPAPGEYAARSPDPVQEKVYEPFFQRWARRFVQLRILQQGQINIYLTYIVLTVVLGLAWMSLRAWWRTMG